jgi:hypothetical protein
VNDPTRSALRKASTDVENAALLLGDYDGDDTLMPGERRQLRTLVSKLNDAANQMLNLVDRADSRAAR